jgi:hypothetical protein
VVEDKGNTKVTFELVTGYCRTPKRLALGVIVIVVVDLLGVIVVVVVVVVSVVSIAGMHDGDP